MVEPKTASRENRFGLTERKHVKIVQIDRPGAAEAVCLVRSVILSEICDPLPNRLGTHQTWYRLGMKLSVIIPAYNEEKYLPETLGAVRAALGNLDAEVIVVDNKSTDDTRKIADGCGASVVDESERNIGKVRNTGARHASGEIFIFVDADTIVRAGIFEKIIETMSDEKCLGGSAAVEYTPIDSRIVVGWFMLLWPILGKLTKMRGGALQFCRSDIFDKLKGYDTTIYVGEDIDFHWRMDKLAKDQGGFTAFIEEPKVLTSSRRWNRMGLIRMLFFTHPATVLLAWRIRSFWKDWYENAIR